jgi:hypothetical protein
MTQRLTVSGTLVPDATTADTGVAAGIHNEEPYWSWTNDAETWYLWWGGTGWNIGNALGGATLVWIRPDVNIVGEYFPIGSTTGTATVAEYEEPPAPGSEKLLVLEWLTGPHAGKYTLLKESI